MPEQPLLNAVTLPNGDIQFNVGDVAIAEGKLAVYLKATATEPAGQQLRNSSGQLFTQASAGGTEQTLRYDDPAVTLFGWQTDAGLDLAYSSNADLALFAAIPFTKAIRFLCDHSVLTDGKADIYIDDVLMQTVSYGAVGTLVYQSPTYTDSVTRVLKIRRSAESSNGIYAGFRTVIRTV